jgi:hypothetical protein
MSTSAQTGKATYTGTNGSNGTVVTAQPNNATNFVASAPAVAATYTNVAVSAQTGKATYTGVNGSNGLTVTAQRTAGSLGTQGSAASGSNGPTYNPGS